MKNNQAPTPNRLPIQIDTHFNRFSFGRFFGKGIKLVYARCFHKNDQKFMQF